MEVLRELVAGDRRQINVSGVVRTRGLLDADGVEAKTDGGAEVDKMANALQSRVAAMQIEMQAQMQRQQGQIIARQQLLQQQLESQEAAQDATYLVILQQFAQMELSRPESCALAGHVEATRNEVKEEDVPANGLSVVVALGYDKTSRALGGPARAAAADPSTRASKRQDQGQDCMRSRTYKSLKRTTARAQSPRNGSRKAAPRKKGKPKPVAAAAMSEGRSSKA